MFKVYLVKVKKLNLKKNITSVCTHNTRYHNLLHVVTDCILPYNQVGYSVSDQSFKFHTVLQVVAEHYRTFPLSKSMSVTWQQPYRTILFFVLVLRN